MDESLIKGLRRTSVKTLLRNGTSFLKYVAKELDIEINDFMSDLEIAKSIKMKIEKDRN
jgi:hypothetical protein